MPRQVEVRVVHTVKCQVWRRSISSPEDLNKREIKLWFPQIDPKAVLSRSKSKNSKALKKMNKHNIKDYLEDIPCVVEGTSKLQMIFGVENPHHQGTKRGPDQKHNSSPPFLAVRCDANVEGSKKEKRKPWKRVTVYPSLQMTPSDPFSQMSSLVPK